MLARFAGATSSTSSSVTSASSSSAAPSTVDSSVANASRSDSALSSGPGRSVRKSHAGARPSMMPVFTSCGVPAPMERSWPAIPLAHHTNSCKSSSGLLSCKSGSLASSLSMANVTKERSFRTSMDSVLPLFSSIAGDASAASPPAVASSTSSSAGSASPASVELAHPIKCTVPYGTLRRLCACCVAALRVADGVYYTKGTNYRVGQDIWPQQGTLTMLAACI